MGTTIRPELSEKNPYWIERHRYYELKHFCLQYPIWKKAYAALDGFSGLPTWKYFQRIEPLAIRQFDVRKLDFIIWNV